MRCFPPALLLLCLFPWAGAGKAEPAAGRRPAVLVIPFANGSPARSQDYLSLGLAEILAERLENESSFVVLNGEIPFLTGPQARLADRPRSGIDLDAAALLAREKGATHVVTGRYSGSEWDWTVTVEILRVGPSGLMPLGSASAKGDQTAAFVRKSGRTSRVVSLANIQSLLTDAADTAFKDAGFRLDPATWASLRAPLCKDSYAFILHQRAVAKHYGLSWAEKRTVLEIAEHAVRVEPTCVPARRLYASLLFSQGKLPKARGQFEAGLKDAPKDARLLAALGELELAAKDPEAALARLEEAVRLRPELAPLQARLGEARLGAGNLAGAIAAHEKARDARPEEAAYRRTLARLYGLEGRHEASAAELRAFLALEPDDREAAFRLGAELRAAGRASEAAAWYAKAAERFKDGRFARYRERLGQVEPMLDADVAAARLLAETAERDRRAAQLAANDVAVEFSLRKRAACESSAFGSAKRAIAAHAASVSALDAAAASLAKARASGDWAMLAFREEEEAVSVLEQARRARRDASELASQLAGTLQPLVQRAGCPEAGTELEPDALAERNALRPFQPSPSNWRPAKNPVSPEIPPGAVRIVRFRIRNFEGTTPFLLTLDETPMGEIAAGSERTFTAKAGSHTLCLLPPGIECGEKGTVRHVFLHEEWTMAVRDLPREP